MTIAASLPAALSASPPESQKGGLKNVETTLPDEDDEMVLENATVHANEHVDAKHSRAPPCMQMNMLNPCMQNNTPNMEIITQHHLKHATPAQIRAACRSNRFTDDTAPLAPGFVQANLVLVPRLFGNAFRSFCTRNPLALPILEESVALEGGDCGVASSDVDTRENLLLVPKGGGGPRPLSAPRLGGPDSDLRTDLPKYVVFRDGCVSKDGSGVSDVLGICLRRLT